MKAIPLCLILISLTLGLSGCATGYKSQGFTGGYSDLQLNDDTFQVSYGGNAYTRGDDARDFLLLRCAELTLENKFRYFVIVDGADTSSPYTVSSPGSSHTTGSVSVRGNTANYSETTMYNPGTTNVFIKPGATVTIKCFSKKPTNAAVVFDAKSLQGQLKTKHGIK